MFMGGLTLIKVVASKSKTSLVMSSFFSGRNRNTIEAYRKDLGDFQQFLRADTIETAIEGFLSLLPGEANALILHYRSFLGEQKLQATTINRKLAAIRSLVKLARMIGAIAWAIEIPNLKVESYRDTKGPGQAAFQQMLAQVEGQRTDKAIRDHAILRFLYDLALRASELTSLDLSDIDIQSGNILILGKGKTQKQRLSLPQPTQDSLTNWLRIRGNEPGPLFINFDRAGKGKRLTRAGLYHMVRKLGGSVGVKTRTHGLRHLSITEACKLAQSNGFGLEEVLDHSRHASVTTLMIYRDRERNVQGQIAALLAETLDRKRR